PPQHVNQLVHRQLRLLDQLHHRQQSLSVLDQKLRQLLALFLAYDVIWFLHDGSPFRRFSQPDSSRTGSENRRSTFNGSQDTFLISAALSAVDNPSPNSCPLMAHAFDPFPLKP